MALGMDGTRRITRTATGDRLVEAFVDWGHGKIVIQELRVLHNHEGVASMKVGNVRMNQGGDGSWIW